MTTTITNQLRTLVLAGALGALLCACDDPTEPVEPVWNKQPCAHCAMVLSEPEHAAQLSTRDGQRLYFDDVGCLAAHLHEDEAGAAGAARAWVRSGAGWRDAFAARYAPGARTPMGFGFVASAGGTHDFAALSRAVVAGLAAGGAP